MSSFYRIIDGPDDLKLRFCENMILQNRETTSIRLKICLPAPHGIEKGREVVVALASLRTLAGISDGWEFEGVMAEQEKVFGLYATRKKVGNLSVL